MSIIQNMIRGLAGALAGLPQTNPQNHALIASSFGEALGAPVDAAIAPLQGQIDDLSGRVSTLETALADAIAGLGTRIDSIPPPYVPSTCLSYRISNVATESTPETDVIYTYKQCDQATSLPITLFAGDFDTICADGRPTIVAGASFVQIDNLGRGDCSPLPPSPTPSTTVGGPSVTPTPTPPSASNIPSTPPLTPPAVSPSDPYNNRSRPGSSPVPDPTPTDYYAGRTRTR